MFRYFPTAVWHWFYCQKNSANFFLEKTFPNGIWDRCVEQIWDLLCSLWTLAAEAAETHNILNNSNFQSIKYDFSCVGGWRFCVSCTLGDWSYMVNVTALLYQMLRHAGARMMKLFWEASLNVCTCMISSVRLAADYYYIMMPWEAHLRRPALCALRVSLFFFSDLLERLIMSYLF